MSTSLVRILRGLAFVGLAACAVGCTSGYDHTEISASRASDLGGSVDRTQINVPEGQIVTAHIVSYNDDGNIMTMNLRATDATVVDVSNVISDHDFAFIGLRTGSTDVQILADNKVVLEITAVVTPQPAAP